MINLIDRIVMISGSRSVNKLPKSALNSLDKIIELGFNTVKIRGNRYLDKDIAMSQVANYGLAIWDGKTKGTQANIKRIKRTKVIIV